ncbi:polysaccharide deacetylase family protein [Romboutsia timonensis]|uniref:polysaccharide deacetylase family protein n=1 Tax=Romboutsia timonensis TaxID=1776391 RepID=UPI002A8356D3|nr:polysaccharide deacetylase family protein [Romboutsia timonensis]MDY3959735.1 polysaccharide deacetylase family protein [Romboutsia timonensis]
MGSRIKNIIKYITIKTSKVTGVTNLFYKLNKDRKIILAYHNVIPDKYFNDYIHLDYSIRESQFRKHLDVIKRRFNVGVDLYNTKEITITFDDGYKNQYSIASKILDEYNMNGYFFYVADLLEEKDILSIDKIQYWLDHVCPGKYENKKYNLVLDIEDTTSRRNQWIKIQTLIDNKVSFDEICDILNDMYRFEDININKKFYDLRFTPIKKYELNDMKENGHKIGAHSSSHNILSNMKKDDLNKDIDKCKDLLNKGIYNTKTFCYPFGGVEDVSEEVMNTVKEKGFSNAMSFMNTKLNNREYGQFFMPRMTLPNTYDEDYIDFILSGTYYFLRNRRLLPKNE